MSDASHSGPGALLPRQQLMLLKHVPRHFQRMLLVGTGHGEIGFLLKKRPGAEVQFLAFLSRYEESEEQRAIS